MDPVSLSQASAPKSMMLQVADFTYKFKKKKGLSGFKEVLFDFCRKKEKIKTPYFSLPIRVAEHAGRVTETGHLTTFDESKDVMFLIGLGGSRFLVCF